MMHLGLLRVHHSPDLGEYLLLIFLPNGIVGELRLRLVVSQPLHTKKAQMNLEIPEVAHPGVVVEEVGPGLSSREEN